MKKIISILVLSALLWFSLINTGLYAQDAQIAFPAAAEPNTIQKSKWPSLYQFQLADGTSLRLKDTLTLLKTVPENTVLLRQEKGFRIASDVGMVIVCGFAIDYLVYQRSNPDALYNGTTSNVIFGGMAVSSITSIVTAGIANDRLNKAVNNYNLTVMGIPIPAGKK
jgi:hypothetical protein